MQETRKKETDIMGKIRNSFAIHAILTDFNIKMKSVLASYFGEADQLHPKRRVLALFQFEKRARSRFNEKVRDNDRNARAVNKYFPIAIKQYLKDTSVSLEMRIWMAYFAKAIVPKGLEDDQPNTRRTKMSGLPPPPPPNAIQLKLNATEALRAALAAAQQAAGRQANAAFPQAIGAADPLAGVAAAPARMELVLRNKINPRRARRLQVTLTALLLRKEGMLGAHPPVAAWNQGGQQLGINISQLSALLQLQHAQNMEVTGLHLKANVAGLEEMKATVKLLVDGHAVSLQQTTDRMEKYQANVLELIGKISAVALSSCKLHQLFHLLWLPQLLQLRQQVACSRFLSQSSMMPSSLI
ncbi:hypothetical protein CAEBREN_24582 [Caenorhabditis brenneri]|uniref:Uncharacterized protein n=1 Tax=Caenorhabditis brenneri TaxID=135651 RepID=G0P933_CAEBE|nr:hypothetical protein CAEBREN_24582 [Caenorhabditis brenneri]